MSMWEDAIRESGYDYFNSLTPMKQAEFLAKRATEFGHKTYVIDANTFQVWIQEKWIWLDADDMEGLLAQCEFDLDEWSVNPDEC